MAEDVAKTEAEELVEVAEVVVGWLLVIGQVYTVKGEQVAVTV